jgi:hypothetical protein
MVLQDVLDGLCQTYVEVKWTKDEVVITSKYKETSGEYNVIKMLDGKMVWIACCEERAMQEMGKPGVLVMKDGLQIRKETL